jgi:uncharacterized membrane protein YccC
MVPLALGVWLGHSQFGVFAALGALTSGLAATTQARAGQHARAVLLSGLGMAVAGFAGAALADRPWPLLAALIVTTCAAGLCGQFSQRVGIAGLQWPVALLLASTSSGHPWLWAALLLSGGAWQALLTGIDRRCEPESESESELEDAAGRARTLRRLAAKAAIGLDPRAEPGQHVLRLTVVVALTDVVAVLTGLPHGYWAAMTALLVLKPGHAATIRRSLDRIGGTACGVLLGVALAGLADAGAAAFLLVAAGTVWLAYAVFTANYFVFCVFLSGFVVLLLDLSGHSAPDIAVCRLVATALGGTMALAASHLRTSTASARLEEC